MINILYVIPRISTGGTEKHLLMLAGGLNEERFKVTICSLFDNQQACAKYRLDGVKFIGLDKKHVYDLGALIGLYKLMASEKYDIVHAYLFGFHYLALLPARLLGVPIKISSRRELATWKKFHHHLLENFGNLFVDKVISCSEAAINFAIQAEQLNKNRIETVYNGIDVNKFMPRQKDQQSLLEFGLSGKEGIVGMVANLSREKDHRTMLKAISEVKKTHPSIRCLLVGDGYLRMELDALAKEYGITENIIFTGQRQDIAEILSVLDIFVLTSSLEGLPNALLEAMSCGVPVIATNAGGIPEAAENGRSAILADPGDYQAIAAGIIRLLKDERLRKEMGGYGRQIIEEKFALEKMVNNYEDIYQKLCAEFVE